MVQTVISTENLSKSFGSTQALKSINLSVKQGTVTGLVGPNGAGKTTLFSLLCGFLQPTQGHIKVLGHEPNSPAIRSRVAVLPQDAAFLKSLPVVKQLTMLAELQGLSQSQARQEAVRVLKAVNLLDSGNQLPERLSHGMLKRVAIAQSLMGKPEILLLDEPTAGLDPNTTDAIKAVIRQLSSQCTIIISSHNLDVIEDLCEQIIILKQGALDSHQAVSDLTARTKAVTFKLEADPDENIAEVFKSLKSVTSVKSGQVGQRRLVVYYNDAEDPMVEIEIIRCLSAAGIQYREMVRGERLQDSVADRTK